MKLVVGLGNPGKQYEATKHNIGFMVIDAIADSVSHTPWREEQKAEVCSINVAGEKVLLVKPQTFMNASGESVGPLMRYYKIDPSDVYCIYDDMDLPVGKLRIRPNGSSGGHNGIKSIIQNLGGDKFPRVKVGVGQPKDNLVNHVLGKFSKEDREHIEKVIPVVSDAIVEIVKNDAKESMNKFNGVNIE